MDEGKIKAMGHTHGLFFVLGFRGKAPMTGTTPPGVSTDHRVGRGIIETTGFMGSFPGCPLNAQRHIKHLKRRYFEYGRTIGWC
ncbi:MAG: hypothetical protein ISS63_14800 [Desulfobacteraceae bacterium]|nr:hypothetical protein [Desulfobacteraceae bacterium]